MLLQRQHFLLIYLKTLRVGPAGVWTYSLPLSRPALIPFSYPGPREYSTNILVQVSRWGFETLTMFRTKKIPKVHTLFRTKPSNLLPGLLQRTCTLFRTDFRETIYPVWDRVDEGHTLFIGTSPYRPSKGLTPSPGLWDTSTHGTPPF